MKRHAQNCGNCNAFHENVQAGQTIGKQCRANPPVAVPCQIPNPRSAIDPRQPQMMQGFMAMWPPTDEKQWCRMWGPLEKVLQ